MARVMEIVTPLGDKLLFYGMHAREELGRLFSFQLDLLSEDGAVKPEDVLGKNVTVKVALPDDSTRYFNGFVTRFSAGEKYGRYHRYGALVQPWLWFLTRTADCRIFQEMSVPDIVKAVLGELDVNDFKMELTGSYRKLVYCVQYRETDFNFISRLLEHEGIYYYFKHTDGHHTMVMTDSSSQAAAFAGYDVLQYFEPGRLARPDVEHIQTWEFGRQIQPGAYVHDDYDLERPSVNLKAQKSLARGHSQASHEMYDYPGFYVKKPDGEQYAGVRIEEHAAQYEAAQASTNARGVCAGYLLKLDNYPRADQNKEHLILAASHDLVFSQYEALPHAVGVDYRCQFTAMATTEQFRPKRITPKPFVQGPQTAVVVGPSGDQIYTDKYGRVKVQFRWDRRGEKNENSSCWIRVSSPWAGKGWGAVATPRIGQEVIVDFLEGDPDQPIITGRVYNQEQLPPFGFPAGAVISGVKSDTHKGSGNNEMSLDDTAGSERVYIHGQFNMDTVIEHDQTSTIHNNRTDRVDVDDSESIGKNQKWDVGVNRDATIGADETLTVGANRTKSIGANETITVGSNRDATVGSSETLTVAMQRTHSVGINETINVGAAQEISVGAMQAITVGANQSTNVGVNQSTEVGANQSIEVGKNASMTAGGDESRGIKGGRATSIGKDDALKVAKNLVVDAGDSVTIKTGSASITMKKDGTITIKGKDIKVEGSGKINVKADSDITMKGSKILQN
jgi:type VI secretion system secreted protein VgrG